MSDQIIINIGFILGLIGLIIVASSGIIFLYIYDNERRFNKAIIVGSAITVFGGIITMIGITHNILLL